MPLVALVPVLEPFILSLASAIMYWALHTIFAKVLEGLASSVPVIGKRLSNGVSGLLEDVRVKSQAFWVTAITPLVALVYTAPWKVDQWMSVTEDTMRKMAYRINGIPDMTANTTGLHDLKARVESISQSVNAEAEDIKRVSNLPHIAEDTIKSWITDAVTQASHTLAADIHRAYVDSLNRAQKDADKAAAVGTAAQDSVNKLAIQVGHVANSLSRVVSQIGNLSPSLVSHDLASILIDAEHYTDHRAQAIDQGIMETLSTGEQYAAGLVRNLSTHVGRVVDNIDSEIVGSKKQLDERIAQVAESGAATLALTQAIGSTFTEYLDKCGLPLCENVRPQIPWMQEIGSLFEDATLFALIAEAIANPEGAAADIEAIMGPFAGLVTGAAASLMPQ